MTQKRGWAWWHRACRSCARRWSRRPRHDWIDGENIPETGGFILVLNHVSHVDPLTAAHIVYDHGRLPRYLAKSGLFKNKALGFFLRAAGQIPVERLSRNAVGAFDAAVAAVRAGRVRRGLPRGHASPATRTAGR